MAKSFFLFCLSKCAPVTIPACVLSLVFAGTGAALDSGRENSLKIVSGELKQARKTGEPEVISSKNIDALIAGGGVFVFFDPACPICAEYFPTLERLARNYGSEKFFLVMRAGVTESAQAFIRDYNPQQKILLDDQALLQERLSARVTPQAFVLYGGKICYSGRIDDRYEAIGRRRNLIRQHDLEAVLDSCRKGLPPAGRVTDAVGCFLEKIDSAKGECHDCK